jgi:hypothetical protein
MNELKDKWRNQIDGDLSANIYPSIDYVADWWLSQFNEILDSLLKEVEGLTYTPSPQGILVFKNDISQLIKEYKDKIK